MMSVADKTRDRMLAGKFAEEVLAWLQATDDPRAFQFAFGYGVEAMGACADFCEFLARVEEAGGEVREWRGWVHKLPPSAPAQAEGI